MPEELRCQTPRGNPSGGGRSVAGAQGGMVVGVESLLEERAPVVDVLAGLGEVGQRT